MQQFILEQIIWRHYILPKIRHRPIRHLFDVAQKLITDQTEIQGIPKMGWHTHLWQRTTLLSDKGVQLSTAKVYVFSDSVLRPGKMKPHPESTDAWKKKIEWFADTSQFRDLDRIDGESMEIEWKSFPGFTTFSFNM